MLQQIKGLKPKTKDLLHLKVKKEPTILKKAKILTLLMKKLNLQKHRQFQKKKLQITLNGNCIPQNSVNSPLNTSTEESELNYSTSGNSTPTQSQSVVSTLSPKSPKPIKIKINLNTAGQLPDLSEVSQMDAETSANIIDEVDESILDQNRNEYSNQPIFSNNNQNEYEHEHSNYDSCSLTNEQQNIVENNLSLNTLSPCQNQHQKLSDDFSVPLAYYQVPEYVNYENQNNFTVPEKTEIKPNSLATNALLEVARLYQYISDLENKSLELEDLRQKVKLKTEECCYWQRKSTDLYSQILQRSEIKFELEESDKDSNELLNANKNIPLQERHFEQPVRLLNTPI